MRVAIFGAGQLGIYLTQRLSNEHDLCIVDLDEEKLGFIASTFDVQTVCGDITKPNIMIEANLKDTDMIIAVTSSDTINVSICDMVYKMYKIPYKAARIRDSEYSRFPKLLNNVDLVIRSFDEMTKQLEQLIFLAGAFFISNFFDNRVQIIGTQVSKGSKLIGYAIKDIYIGMDDVRVKIISIHRDNKELNLNDTTTTIKENDRIVYISEKAYASQIISIFQPQKTNVRKVFIAGINHSSITLAKSLERKGYVIKMIDPNAIKCSMALEELSKTTVLQYNPVNNNLLIAEGIDEIDMFFALTNSDEINVMSSILAKKLGAKKSIATINNSEYHSITRDLNLIDLSISPHNFSYTAVKAFMTQADVLKMYEIDSVDSYVVEVVAHGENKLSPIIGKKVNEINLNGGIDILAILKDKTFIFSPDNTIIESEDRLIIQLKDEKAFTQLENLFQVMPLYIA